MRYPAVKFRRKIYVAHPHHADAIALALKGMSTLAIHRAYDRVVDGKENIVFGFANIDGSDWYESDSQDARKKMYGFKD